MDDRDDEDDGRRVHDSERIKRYISNTRYREPHKGIINLVKEMEPGNAIEFGPGAGNDAIFLLENGWRVTGVDFNKEVEQEIISRIKNDNEKQKFSFINSRFEDIKNKGIKKNYYDLACGFDSLSFCSKEYFLDMWNEIASLIKPGGILLVHLFGENDDFSKEYNRLLFFSRSEVIKLIKMHYSLNENNPKEFKEIEGNGKKANGELKHWHKFIIMAKKIKS